MSMNKYNRDKMFNYCTDDNTLGYMKKRNDFYHQIRIDQIRNRKNNFLPKINSRRSIVKSPKRRPEERKIEEENYKIFRNLFSIDYRMPVLSEKKYLNKRYIKELKKERNEINQFQKNMIINSKKSINKKILLSPINQSHKDKYDLYTEKNA